MGFLAGSTRHGADGGTSSAPSRQASEQELNQFNLQLKSNPIYQRFLYDNGLVDHGQGVKLSRGQQGELEQRLIASGMTIPSGMHIDQGGNFNQKNRLARNVGIGAGIAAGGYFAAPAIAGALGGGGAAGGAGAASGAAAGGGAAGGAGLGGAAGAGSLLAGGGATAGTALGGGALTGGGAMLGGAGAAAGTGTAAAVGTAASAGKNVWNNIVGENGPSVGDIVKKGAGTLAGGLAARWAQNSAMKRSPEEQAALGGASRAASTLGTTGSGLITRGQETTNAGLSALGGAANYWKTLLTGNRAAMSQATAGARAGITDTYRGAERGLERSGIRGAQRDVASAELNRSRASQIAGLTTGVQPFAAQQLAGTGGTIAQLGNQTTGQGAPMLGQSGLLYSNLLGQGAANRIYGRSEGERAGKSIGGFVFDLITGRGGSKPTTPWEDPDPWRD